MEGAFKKTERRGLPGGPNETFTYTTGVFSTQGYKADSPDVNNPFNIIPSGNITMDGVEFPVHGVDNLGNSSIMLPGNDYEFPGDMVLERPIQNLNLKNNSSRKNVLGYGFAFPETREGNFIAGAGVNFLPIGTQFGVTGVLPMQSNPVFKGVGTAGVSQQIGDFNIGIGANKDFLNDYETGQRLDTPIKPSFNVRYTKTFQDGGSVNKIPFEDWYKTVPKSKNDTISYNLRRAYELAPQEELDAFVNTDAHLRSAYKQPNGIYEFVKRKDHPTVQKEINWFNSPDAAEFREQYELDDSGEYYRYIPKKQLGGDINNQATYKGDDLYQARYMLPEVTVEAKPSFAKDLPYYDYLKPEEKEWLRKNKNSDDAITRSIRAQAKEGYGINGNPTYGQSAYEAAVTPFRETGTIAAELTGIPSAYRISQDPMGTLEGLGNTAADLQALPITAIQAILDSDNPNLSINPLTEKPYGSGLAQTGDVLSVLPAAGLIGKGLKQGVKYTTPLMRQSMKQAMKSKLDDADELIDLWRVEPANWGKMVHPTGPKDPMLNDFLDSYYPYDSYGRWFEKDVSRLLNNRNTAAPGILDESGQLNLFNVKVPKSKLSEYNVKGTPFEEWSKSPASEYVIDFDRSVTPKITFDNTEEGWQSLANKLKKQSGGETEKKTTLKSSLPPRELYNPKREQVKPYQSTSEEDYQQRSKAYSDSLSLHKMSYDKLMSTGWSDKEIDAAKRKFDRAEDLRDRGRTTPSKRGLLVAQDISDASYREQYEAFLDENMRRGIKRTETFEEFKEMAEGVPGIKSTFAYYPPGMEASHSPNLYYTNPVQPILPYKDEAEAKKAQEAAELKVKQDTFSSIGGSVIPVVMAEDTTDLRGYKFRTKYGEKFVPIDDVDTLKQYSEMYGLDLPIKQPGGEYIGKLIEQPKPVVRNPISIEPRSAELFENKKIPLKEMPVRYTSTQFPGVRVAHYPDGTKAYVNEEGQMSEYTYGQIPGFDKSFQYQTGREVKVDDGTGNITTINTSSQEYKNLYPNLAYRDDDGTPVFYMPEIEVAYDKNTGDALPYYSYLSPSQKQWLETHQGADDPITRSIRSQARSGYGIGDNPTWMESAGDAARSFAFSGPITALNTLSVPQALMVEGIEQLRGNPYDYSRAFDISPLTNTRDQGMFYTDQRFPSQTLLDEDAPFALKLGLDVLADPTNLIPAKAFGTLAKGTSAAAKYKQLLRAKKLGEDIPEATLKFAERQAIKEYQSSVSPFAKSASQIERKVDNWVPGEKWHDAINPFIGKKIDKKIEQAQAESIKTGQDHSKAVDNYHRVRQKQHELSNILNDKRLEYADDFYDTYKSPAYHDYIKGKAAGYQDDVLNDRFAQRSITDELEGNSFRLDSEGNIIKMENPGQTQYIYKAAGAARIKPKPNEPIIDFTTGQPYKPKDIAPTAGTTKYTLVDGKVKSETPSGNRMIGIDEGLSNVYSKNENFIKEQIPGFYPMGSSQYHKFGVSHITGDFDGIIKAEDWNKIKDNFQNATGKAKYGPTISLRNPDLPGNPVVGEVDINILKTNPETGKAEGGLAMELYRQFFPDEFYKANEEAIKKIVDAPPSVRSSGIRLSKKSLIDTPPITINKTADEILGAYDPEIKSILDAFEAGGVKGVNKEKHINKIDYIIETADPEKVLKAQELFSKSIMGKNADLGRQFSPQAFSDYENNLKILEAIKQTPNSLPGRLRNSGTQNTVSYIPEEIAKNPAKMQIALNDFYINSSIYTRRIDPTSQYINSYEDVLDAYKTWIGKGGEAMGVGTNSIKLGEPGLQYGDVIGNRQFKLYDPSVSETPLEYVKSVTNKVSGSRAITQADKETIIKLAKKNNINLPENTRIETFGDLLDIRAHAIGLEGEGRNVDEIGGFLKDVGNEFGMKVISRGPHGNSEYATILGNIDGALDNLTLALGEYTPELKSSYQRVQNLRQAERIVGNAVSDLPVNIRNYKVIEGYLDGGLEVALKRQKEVDKAVKRARLKQQNIQADLQNLYVERKIKEFNQKDGRYAKLLEEEKQADEIVNALDKQQDDIYKTVYELNKRKARLKSIRTDLTAIGGIGGTVASGTYMMAKVNANDDERRARWQYVEVNSDKKIKELEKLYPDETYQQLYDRSRGLLYKEFGALGDEEKQKWFDLFEKDRAARLNKKQTGGEMVRDNTYVDIKAPQFYEAPVDNTRVEKKIVPEPMTLAQNIDFEGLKKGIAQAESLGGTLMINPESTATGLYGQRFSEIEDFYKGTREDFAKDTTYQEELFKKRFYEGLKDTKTTALQKDAMDLYDEYNMQFEDFPYSYEDIAALSNFLGRQGTREYFGYVLRDGKPLEEVFPTKYGPKAKQANKTPEEYLKITRPYYTKSDGGEILKVYADYINGVLDNTPMYKKGGRIYDKLNRIYYKDAKAVGMSSPNYIMTYLVN